jgi:flagellar biosynthesis protein FlhB
MADESDTSDKTEDPTQKRIDQAVESGDVVKSQELNTWFLIAAATLVMSTFSGSIATSIMEPMRNLIAKCTSIPTDGFALLALAKSLEYRLLGALGLPIAFIVFTAIGGNMVQHQLVFSAQPLQPKLSKISPLSGFKRLFGKQTAVNFAKGLFKLILIGSVMAMVLWPERTRLESIVQLDPALLPEMVRSTALHLLGAAVAMLAVIAVADYAFQYHQWYEKLKMSLQEVKDEHKQSEGDPRVKGRLRQMRVARMRKRMMAAVPKASVIITNPTHYSVALQYNRGMSAPICVAKGVDHLAFKIREIAREHDIPIVENVTLARTLYATVEVDAEIPVEHYHAVAEIIGYVMGLRRTLNGRRV